MPLSMATRKMPLRSLATALRERGVKTVMYDVSVIPASEIIAGCFRYSHLVFAATTYNAGIFISMEELLRDLVAHNIQNRTVALIENGTWARDIRQTHAPAARTSCKNMTFLGETVTPEIVSEGAGASCPAARPWPILSPPRCARNGGIAQPHGGRAPSTKQPTGS